MKSAIAFSLLLSSLGMSQWTLQPSGTTERLRGVSAFSTTIAWASGNHGTILRTTDGGSTWNKMIIPGTDSLDFRDVDAVSPTAAYVLSIGPGEQSRIYKTTDRGKSWIVSFQNREPRAFFDAMAFWDERSGIAVGDEVDDRLTVIRTTDGGTTWSPVAPEHFPRAVPGEGAFAASGTNVAVLGAGHAWIGSGVNCARVYRSSDRGRSWQVSDAPIASSNQSSGIFSVLFLDSQNGIVVGGDYREVDSAGQASAFSSDGGKSWIRSVNLPAGFRSCVARVPRTPAVVAVGPNGSDFSRDRGMTWAQIDTTGFHAASFAGPNAGWAVGEQGLIARFSNLPEK